MPTPLCFLGIDQGTTTTTAVVVDEAGRVVDRRSAPVTPRFPAPGRVEQDPWEVLETVRAVAAPLIETYPILAAGFDNQGETFVLWDGRTGEPLTPAIVWQDQRGAALCAALRERVDAAWLRHKTGLLLDSYFTAPKLRVVLDENPHLAEAARAGWLRFGTLDAWVLWHLTPDHRHITDASTAARTLLYDIHRRTWDDELLALFDVPRGILPEIVPGAGHAADLDFGTGRPLPLHALLVDQQAALFGQACFQPGEVKCTFGTGSFVLMNIGPEPRASAHQLLTTVAWELPSQTAYALDGGIFVTGAAVQWLSEGLGLISDPASSAAMAEAGGGEVVCVPALAGLAAPYWRTDVRGAYFGLSRATTPADLVRATLEGIVCRVVDVVAAMQADAGQFPTALKVDGGPAGNPFLMQCLADLLNLEVRVAAERESTAIGIANLAAHAALGTTLDDLAGRWQAEATYTPRLDATERERRLARWRRALASVQHYHEVPSP